MKVLRRGNGDISLTLTQNEFRKLKECDEKQERQDIATAEIIPFPPDSSDPLEGKKVAFIYDASRDRDCGLDCSEMIKHFNSPPIPVYISSRAVKRLEEGEFCGSCYADAKLEIKLE